MNSIRRLIAAMLCCAVLPLAGCATNPDGSVNWSLTGKNVVAGANSVAAAAVQIGKDAVVIDCNDANLAYVIAKDANAQSRVQTFLAINAQIVKDACPALLPAGQIIVQTGASVAAPS